MDSSGDGGKRADQATTNRRATKTCATCGRSFEWRRRWERHWETVRYCGDRCRTHRPGAVDRALEEAILALLGRRTGDGSICPSEAARSVFPDAWEPLMERTRQAARRLVAEGKVVITQRGRPVDPDRARGPIRIARGGGTVRSV
jgi:hypothetical protein